MNANISNVRLSYTCPAAWNQMQPTTDGRHCNQCNKTVYDFTNAKQAEFLQILAEQSGHLCGRFQAGQLAPQPIVLHGWKKWASAALVLLGINVFQQANAQSKKQSRQTTTVSDKNIVIDSTVKGNEPFLTGIVEPIEPTFPGGQQALHKFLIQNIHYPKGAITGRVIIAFTISKTGHLTDIRILRGLNTVNNTEVLRVLKLMPKWIPAQINGHAVAVQYTLPINFAAK